MFSITYKIIYTPGDVGKGEQKELEGTLLLEFSFQVSKTQVIGKKRCSSREAGFLLIHATEMLVVLAGVYNL